MFSGVFPVGKGAFSRPSEYLYSALQMPFIFYESCLEYSSATQVFAWTPVTGRVWCKWQLDLIAATGFWKINGLWLLDVLKAWSDRDVSITYGGVWNQTAPSTALNATVSEARTAGRTATFSVTGASTLYLVLSKLSNCGYANITIDGGTALVNELPLVGGNRQLNCYDAGNLYNERVAIASGLNPASTYTVVVTVAGTKPAESSGTRVYLEGYGVFTTTINDVQIGTLLYDRKSLYTIGYTGSENECAINYKPAGASNYAWTGSGHGNENITSVTWKDAQGNDKTVSVGTTRTSAGVIVLEQIGTSRHPDTTPTDHANVLYRTTFDSMGITVYHSHTWLTAASIDTAYTAMWAFRVGVNRGHVAGDNQQIYNLTIDDGRFCGQKKEALAAMWFVGCPYVFWLYLPNLASVNNWANSSTHMSIEDRVGSSINKIYAQRVGGAAVNVAISDVWTGTAYYRVSSVALPETGINWV